MKIVGCLLWVCAFLPFRVEAQEHGRVKTKHLTQAEADRIASETAMSDSILRNGDIVATDRGFVEFRGFLQDGTTAIFVPVANPLSNMRK